MEAGEPLIGSMGVQWAWDNLEHASRKDMKRMLAEAGGEPLSFVSISTAPNQPRGPVALYPNVVVQAKTPSGEIRELRWIFAVVERDGAFKILRYKQSSD